MRQSAPYPAAACGLRQRRTGGAAASRVPAAPAAVVASAAGQVLMIFLFMSPLLRFGESDRIVFYIERRE